MDQVECVVIGAGVVGLAVARALALRRREVMVLEAAPAIGMGISSRNSEVIHAGIYYPAGSFKARFCVHGAAMLYDYCAERGIAHRRCGKLIVATAPEQVAQLQGIVDKASGNGVKDLLLLTSEEAQSLEPQLLCEAAIFSPNTGIVDSHSLMQSLHGDITNAGSMVVLNSTLEHAECAQSAIRLVTGDGTQLTARIVVNAAGLQASALARRFLGLDPVRVPRTWLAKGNYFSLAGRVPFNHLIYPVPETNGLGVHLTLDLAGQAKFGPDVQWVDSDHDFGVDPARGDVFYAEVRKYWPGLQDGALTPAYAGIRPKIHAPGEAACDFLIQGPAEHGVTGLVNLFGIESPGLTSALALGAHVATLV